MDMVENYPSIIGYLSKISLAFCMLSSVGHAFVKLGEEARVMQRIKKGFEFLMMLTTHM